LPPCVRVRIKKGPLVDAIGSAEGETRTRTWLDQRNGPQNPYGEVPGGGRQHSALDPGWVVTPPPVRRAEGPPSRGVLGRSREEPLVISVTDTAACYRVHPRGVSTVTGGFTRRLPERRLNQEHFYLRLLSSGACAQSGKRKSAKRP